MEHSAFYGTPLDLLLEFLGAHRIILTNDKGKPPLSYAPVEKISASVSYALPRILFLFEARQGFFSVFCSLSRIALLGFLDRQLQMFNPFLDVCLRMAFISPLGNR